MKVKWQKGAIVARALKKETEAVIKSYFHNQGTVRDGVKKLFYKNVQMPTFFFVICFPTVVLLTSDSLTSDFLACLCWRIYSLSSWANWSWW